MNSCSLVPFLYRFINRIIIIPGFAKCYRNKKVRERILRYGRHIVFVCRDCVATPFCFFVLIFFVFILCSWCNDYDDGEDDIIIRKV